jgi:hypothetical protein
MDAAAECFSEKFEFYTAGLETIVFLTSAFFFGSTLGCCGVGC